MSAYISIILWITCLSGSLSLPDGDLCRWMNGRKYYIDVGESGTITLWNVTSRAGEGSDARPRIPQRCSVELITCPSCHITVSVLYLNVPTCSADGSCRCDYVWIREPAYGQSGREFCGFENNGSSLYYRSKTKLVSVDFLYSYSYTDAFSLQFTAEKNIYRLTGGQDYYQSNNTGYFESPYFPVSYPSDYVAEYILTNIDSNGFVQLLFVDFRLSPWSYVELFDSNGTRIDLYNGNIFRPPAISSSGPSLSLKFRANDEHSSSGFKAQYTFVNYPEKYWFNKPLTDCGGYVDDFGGAITMMNMVNGKREHIFDCIWLIHPRSSNTYETHIAIRVAQFEDMGAKSTLEIRQGLTSESYLLESVAGYRHHKISRGQEYVVPSSTGFYVRLKGFFGNKSHLAITYVSFRYDDCYTTGDFECANGRCIKHALRCDGFNHCGDGTDEAACFGNNKGALNPEDASWWRTMTPNYYFPKPTSSSNAGTNTLILITSLAGLGMFVLTTVMILVKLHRQRRDDSSREALHTISREVDGTNILRNGNRSSSDPPRYDPPPSYEDVVKYYLPPPPTYNSVMGAHNNIHRQTTLNNTEGFENSAFISSNSNLCQEQISHTTSNDNVQHLVLRVNMPTSPNRTTKISSAESSTNPQSVNEAISTEMETNTLHPEMFLGGINYSQSTTHVKWPDCKNPSNNLKRNVSVCNCHGACSCPLSSEVKLKKLKCHVHKVIPDRQSEKTSGKKHLRYTSLPLHVSKVDNREFIKLPNDKYNCSRNKSESGKHSNILFPFLQNKNGNFQNTVLSSLTSIAQVLRDPKVSNEFLGQFAKIHPKNSLNIAHPKQKVILNNKYRGDPNYIDHSSSVHKITATDSPVNYDSISSSNIRREDSARDQNNRTKEHSMMRRVSSQPNLLSSSFKVKKTFHKHSKSDASDCSHSE